jgi:uncharacterized protein (TIGR02271 family)
MVHVPATNGGARGNFPHAGARVVDSDGQDAQVISVQQGAEPTALLHTAGGDEIALPADLLQMQNDGSYSLAFRFDALHEHEQGGSASLQGAGQTVIPVWREELHVGKRTVETGKGIRIHKMVKEREETVDQPLLQDELAIERVPVGTMVAEGEQPGARYEGDTLIVPVFEEVLVVERRLRLKEEVRITRRKREMHAPQTVVLRSEEVSIERFGNRPSADPARHATPVQHSSAEGEPGPGKTVG